MIANEKAKFYVVIKVWRGVIEDVWAFRDLEKANHFMEKEKKKINPDEDDVAIFEINEIL